MLFKKLRKNIQAQRDADKELKIARLDYEEQQRNRYKMNQDRIKGLEK